MFVDMILFMYLAYSYKSLDTVVADDEPLEDETLAKPAGIDNVAFTRAHDTTPPPPFEDPISENSNDAAAVSGKKAE